MRRPAPFEPVDGSTIQVFRVLFGAVMIVEVLRVWAVANTEFPEIEFRPTWGWMRWVRDWPQPDLNLFAPILLGCLAAVTVGIFTRIAAAVFAVVYGGVFLLDPSHFNNHYVLITLLGGCLVVVRSSGGFSLESRLRSTVPIVPRWQLALLQGHFVLVYFYGGLAKLTPDWLHGEPAGAWLANHARSPLLGPLVTLPGAVEVIAWGGLVFDLAIPFLLLWSRTRPVAIALTVVFHLANSMMYRIGPFPWLCLAANVLFLRPDTPRRWWERWHGAESRAEDSAQPTPSAVEPRSRWVPWVLGAYAIVHLVVPFRHHLCRGNVDWTEECKAFSWRMMVSLKSTFLEVSVYDPATEREWVVDGRGRVLAATGGSLVGTRRLLKLPNGTGVLVPSRFLSVRQAGNRGVEGNPRLLHQWAEFLAEEARGLGIDHPVIRARCVASLNGRPFQWLVDPDVDLLTATVPVFGTPEWVVPLRPSETLGDYPETPEEFAARVNGVLEGNPPSDELRTGARSAAISARSPNGEATDALGSGDSPRGR